MSYLIKHSTSKTVCIGDLNFSLYGQIDVYARGLSSLEERGLVDAYLAGTFSDFLNTSDNQDFSAILIDRQHSKVVAVNDKFGHYEIYHTVDKNESWITDDIALLYETRGGTPTISSEAFYEHLEFYTVCPPRTIFKNIFAVPMATYIVFGSAGVQETVQYWNLQMRFDKKTMIYSLLLKSLKDALLKVLRRADTMTSVVALSGGIDSGGLLGMIVKTHKHIPSAISIGPHGETSSDLASARETVRELKVKHTTVLPSLPALAQILGEVKGLNQPISADILFPNVQIMQAARAEGLRELVFGFGSEMLLGSLKFGVIVHKLRRIERLMPCSLWNVATRILLRAKCLSHNQAQFLKAGSLLKRFLLVRAPLFERNKFLYRKLPSHLCENIENWVGQFLCPTTQDRGDDAVRLYMFTWENYIQNRDISSLARRYGLVALNPFDTPTVAEMLFTVSTKHRKESHWDKALIRDVFQPYVSDRLYKRVGKSLVIPYTTLLSGKEKVLFSYLRTSPLINEYIDIEGMEQNYAELPEPGLLLVRIVALAAWYDVNWNTSNIENLKKAQEAMGVDQIPNIVQLTV